MGTLPTLLTTTPQPEDALTPQTMATDLPWTIVLWPDTELPLERRPTFW
jgi:hypothetical protein